jgi:hypothetical protein
MNWALEIGSCDTIYETPSSIKTGSDIQEFEWRTYIQAQRNSNVIS